MCHKRDLPLFPVKALQAEEHKARQGHSAAGAAQALPAPAEHQPFPQFPPQAEPCRSPASPYGNERKTRSHSEKWRLQNSPAAASKTGSSVATVSRTGCGIPAARAPLRSQAGAHRSRAARRARPGARSTPFCRQPALLAPLVQLDGWILLYQQLGSPLSARKPCSHVCLPLDISQRGREKQFTANVPFISQQMLLELLLHVKYGACPAQLGSLHRTRGARVNTPAPLPPGIKTLGGCKIDTP